MDQRQPPKAEPTTTESLASQRGLVVFLVALAVYLGVEMVGGCGPAARVELEEAPRREFSFRLDVNRATWPELVQLPGVGRGLAERIVKDREVNGPFRSVEDLKRVKGIGDATLESLRPHVTVSR